MSRRHTADRLVALLFAGLATAPVAAMAQQPGYPGIVFDGVAQTGSDTRPVRFRFYCTSNNGPNVTGVLSVEMEVPHVDQLVRVFDFIPFEGPDSTAGALTHLQAIGAKGRTQADFTVAGFIPAPDTMQSFVWRFPLRCAAPRRRG